jgi:hypothetical protein
MNTHTHKYLAIAIISAITYGCGGGGGDSPAPATNGTGATTGTGNGTTSGTGTGTTTGTGTGTTTGTGSGTTTGTGTNPGSTLTYSAGLQGTASGVSIIVGKNNELVAVSDTGLISKSLNGADWSDFAVSGITSASGIRSTRYLNGSYIAVGENIGSATDASSWTNATRANNWPLPIRDVAYGGGRYVAVGFSTAADPSSGTIDQSAVLSSTDGLNWGTTGITAPSMIGKQWTGVAFGNGVFVAVGGDSGFVSNSGDGLTWGSINIAPAYPGVAFQKITFSGSKFIAAANNGFIYLSDTGTSWTQIAANAPKFSGGSDANVLQVTCSSGTFCVASTNAGANSTLLYSNADQTVWSRATYTNGTVSDTYLSNISTGIRESTKLVLSIAPPSATSGNKWLAVGQSGLLLESTDGKAWTRRTAR